MLSLYLQESVRVPEEPKFSSETGEEVLGGEAAGETCLVEEHAESISSLTLPVSRLYTPAAEDKSSSDGTEFSKKNTLTQKCTCDYRAGCELTEQAALVLGKVASLVIKFHNNFYRHGLEWVGKKSCKYHEN